MLTNLHWGSYIVITIIFIIISIPLYGLRIILFPPKFLPILFKHQDCSFISLRGYIQCSACTGCVFVWDIFQYWCRIQQSMLSIWCDSHEWIMLLPPDFSSTQLMSWLLFIFWPFLFFLSFGTWPHWLARLREYHHGGRSNYVFIIGCHCLEGIFVSITQSWWSPPDR